MKETIAVAVSATTGIDAFVALLNAGIESWVKAGELLIQMRSQDAEIFSKIQARAPHITDHILRTFERIGQRSLFPHLLIQPSQANSILLQMPYELQVKFHSEPVAVVTGFGDPPPVIYLLARDMSKNQVRLAFSSDGHRSVVEQVKLLAIYEKNRFLNHAARNPSPPKMKSLGRFRILWRFGKPEVTPAKGATALDAVRIVMTNNMGDSAVYIELVEPMPD